VKKVTIKAFNGTGKDKVLAGERAVDMPETTEEAVKLFGEEDALDYITSSYTIEVQRQIRAGTTMSARQQLRALEAYVKANPDSEVTKTLESLKITFLASKENAQ
jgi:hypothetical protein